MPSSLSRSNIRKSPSEVLNFQKDVDYDKSQGKSKISDQRKGF